MQFAQSENAGIMYAARKACTYIEKFNGRIANSLEHNRIILLAIEVSYSFVHGTVFNRIWLPLIAPTTCGKRDFWVNK